MKNLHMKYSSWRIFEIEIQRMNCDLGSLRLVLEFDLSQVEKSDVSRRETE